MDASAASVPRAVYWPIDVMVACMVACDALNRADDPEQCETRQEALAIYAVASAAREAGRKMPIPAWLEEYVEES
jgi:myo-inositol catabolism protein IolC